ncbi:MAG: hypothetical protein JXR26_06890 [Balneolaceae bacterium]|nr:hypothetical protein [Balneolaceae bacterium]
MRKSATAVFAITIRCTLFAGTSITRAQTIYKSDPGFFTPLLESFELRGGSLESTQLIGPAAGYRFNKKFDIALHTEFLSSERKFNTRPNSKVTLLNLGITFGHTRHFSESIKFRSEVSLYKSFNFQVENYPDDSEPSLNSALTSSSLYAVLPLSDTIRLLPNAGGFIGYGSYEPVFSATDLTQGFDGLMVGPKFGLAGVFELSDDIYFSVTPAYHIRYFNKYDTSNSDLTIDFRLNF